MILLKPSPRRSALLNCAELPNFLVIQSLAHADLEKWVNEPEGEEQPETRLLLWVPPSDPDGLASVVCFWKDRYGEGKLKSEEDKAGEEIGSRG